MSAQPALALQTPAPPLAVVSAATYIDARFLLAFVGTFMLRSATDAMNYRFLLIQGGCVVRRAIPLRERRVGGYVRPMGASAYRGWKLSNGW